jgi:hypothetical protein
VALSRRRDSVTTHETAYSVGDYRWNRSSGGRFAGTARRTARAVTQPVKLYSRTPCTATTRDDARHGEASPHICSAGTARCSITADSPRLTALSPSHLASLLSLLLAQTSDSSTRYRTVSSKRRVGVERSGSTLGFRVIEVLRVVFITIVGPQVEVCTDLHLLRKHLDPVKE